MASAAQIEANRRNAQKSTGPKTEQGRARARLNALTHGLSARIVGPVLPGEDPRTLDERIRTWTEQWQTDNDMQTELVAHAAKLSWTLERAERIDTVHLADRVRDAQRHAAGATDPLRVEEVADLGRQLLGSLGWEGSRAVPAAKLKATPEGCRWLLDRWVEIEILHSHGVPDELADLVRFIHLLGKEAIEAVIDPELNALVVAWDVLKPGIAREFWSNITKSAASSPSFSKWASWRELGPRPASPAEALTLMSRTREQEVECLKTLLADHEQSAAEEAADLPYRAAYDPDPGLERHRRHREKLGRELLRTLDTLRKMQGTQRQEEDVEHETDRLIDQVQNNPTEMPAHDQVEFDRIGVLSQEEEDTIEILSHEEAGRIGVLSHEEDCTVGMRAQGEADSRNVQNEANYPLSQVNDAEEVASEIVQEGRGKRSQFAGGEPSAGPEGKEWDEAGPGQISQGGDVGRRVSALPA